MKSRQVINIERRHRTMKITTAEKYIRELHKYCTTEPVGVEPVANPRYQATSGVMSKTSSHDVSNVYEVLDTIEPNVCVFLGVAVPS